MIVYEPCFHKPAHYVWATNLRSAVVRMPASEPLVDAQYVCASYHVVSDVLNSSLTLCSVNIPLTETATFKQQTHTFVCGSVNP